MSSWRNFVTVTPLLPIPGDVCVEFGERRLEDHAGEEAGVAAAGAHGDEAAHGVTVQEARKASKFSTYLQKFRHKIDRNNSVQIYHFMLKIIVALTSTV